jgi:hypothetical protein
VIASRAVRHLALLVLLGIACGKDSSGPGPLPTGTLVLSPPGAGFIATEGGANPAANTITITNGSTGTLGGVRTAITFASNQPTGWLTASLSDTTTPSTLTLNATTGSLGLGSYSAFVAISANGATNAPQIIEVVFLVSVVGVFVSESDPQAADNSGCGLGPVGWGTGFYPCSSITQGIARAGILGRTKVLVADGLYDESVAIVNGISVLGGHQPDTWQRHVTTTNTVIQGAGALGSHQFAVRATGVSAATVFEGFVVRGPSNGSLGGNSYAMYVANSNANLTIRNNVIFGGRGGPGSAGSTGSNGAPGVDGGGRAANPTGYDAFITTGTEFCSASNNRQLSNGGFRAVGTDDISGGRGGGNSCPVSTSRQRLSAQNAFGGNAGAGTGGGANGSGGAGGFDGTDSTSVTTGRICFLPTSPMEGDSGSAGSAGSHGIAGIGGSNGTGSVSGGHWTGTPATGGVAGGNGGGGGGGGAGGGAIRKGIPTPRDILGGHGGGGGSGGGGGVAGGPGGAGGGAFGLFILATAPTVSDNIIVRGEGGSGGSGGNAGAGGLAGTGGAGGVVSPTVFCAGAGGKGGDGGAGGHGGGGGGGSGGASYGLYTSGTGPLTICDAGSNNVISGGAGGSAGAGGGSLVNPGGAGTAGVNVTCSFH